MRLTRTSRHRIRPTVCALLLTTLVSACASQSGASASAVAATVPLASASPTLRPPGVPVNPAAIPLGDGHVSTSPKVGYVDSCTTAFNGQSPVGPWINTTAGTWDSLTKPSSAGSVSWPNATYSSTVSGSTRVIATNDLPINHPTGTFPITASDPAYQYDHNPNFIAPTPTTIDLPANPTAAAAPNCLRLGPIGVLNDGVFLFDALDAAGHDAGAHEVLDQWAEHPQNNHMLHHHYVPSFMLDQVSHAPGAATLVGYAADGYGIFAEYDSSGHLLTDADLDACHGRTSAVMWNGSVQTIYHYDVTLEYPYTVGCYHGTPVAVLTPPNG